MVGGAHPDTPFVGVQNTTPVGSAHNPTPVGEAHNPPDSKAHIALWGVKVGDWSATVDCLPQIGAVVMGLGSCEWLDDLCSGP